MPDPDAALRKVGTGRLGGFDGELMVCLRRLITRRPKNGVGWDTVEIIPSATPIHHPVIKKLQIILDPSDLDSVTDILKESAVRHFIAAELKEFGVGTQEGVFRGRAYKIRFKARITVEAILPAETVPQVVAALRKVVPPARQLEVYVSPVESLDMAVPAKSPVLAGTGAN